MISESEFGIKGHGVHTAYVEMVNALKGVPGVELGINQIFKRFDVVHIQTMGLFGLFMLCFARGKKVVSAHIITDSLIGSLRGAKQLRWFTDKYLAYFYKKADIILAVSEKVKQNLVHTLKVDEDRITICYNTIDAAVYKNNSYLRKKHRKELGVSDDTFVVVGNGQIQPRKRFDIFVDMAKQMPDVQFFWVGGIPFKYAGADYNKMQKLIAASPRNLYVTGIIPLESVKKYLIASDVFVLPAEQENHPLAVLEAAAADLPIVLRNIPEYDDTFGDDAFRVDNNEFAAAVQRLRSDAALRNLYRKKAKIIAKKFDSSASAQRLKQIYVKTLR